MTFDISQCWCTSNCINDPSNNRIIYKRIQNQVRVSQSQYNDVLSANTINGGVNNIKFKCLSTFAPLDQFQSSDRNKKHFQKAILPTRLRPGSLAPGGTGVDVKHNSYYRYLGRLKAQNLQANWKGQTMPTKDNSKINYSILGSGTCNIYKNNN